MVNFFPVRKNLVNRDQWFFLIFILNIAKSTIWIQPWHQSNQCSYPNQSNVVIVFFPTMHLSVWRRSMRFCHSKTKSSYLQTIIPKQLNQLPVTTNQHIPPFTKQQDCCRVPATAIPDFHHTLTVWLCLGTQTPSVGFGQSWCGFK